MMRTILVPLDGSPLAELALPYAQALAGKAGGRLLLLRAAWAERPVDEHWGEAQARAVREAEAYLAEVAARLRAAGLEVDSAVPYGDAAGAIVDQLEQGKADLVVMATHGRSGLGRVVYGSVAKDVLGRSPVPVLLVHAWRRQPPALSEAPRILVALDGSAFAEAVLPAAEALARLLGASLVLLRAVQPPEHAIFDEGGRMLASIDQELERLRVECEDYLAEVAERLALPRERVARVVKVGRAAEAIRTASEEHQVALVAMATHGRTGLSRLLLGSVAGAVLRSGDVPLLLVRPAEAREPVEAPPREAPAGEEATRPAAAPAMAPLPEAALLAVPSASAEAQPSAGLSPVERMLDAFEAHLNAEAESLRAYEALAAECEDPVARLLMQMVLSDEERHHELLRRMVSSLRDDINWTHSPDSLPAQPLAGPVRASLLEATRARLREEQEGARHARELARAQRGLYDGLFELLLQVVAADSEKHERILRFILRRLEQAEKSAAAARLN